MRLFVGVRPPDEVLDLVADLPRPAREGLRWTTRPQWHVTLRFLGEVADPAPVIDALDAVGSALTALGEVVLGPRVEALSARVVSLPVAGLDGLASAVVAATERMGRPPEDRPFRSHLTLARASHGSVRRLASAVIGQPLSAHFAVADIRLVRSHLGRQGARYEDIFVRRLG